MRTRAIRPARGAAIALVLASASVAAAVLPQSRLEVRGDERWTPWWRSDRAPAAWRAADPAVAGAVAWRPAAAGIEVGRLELRGSGEAWRLTVVVVRADPARLRFELATASHDSGTLPAWSLDDVPDGAVLALNAGQFTGGFPWGWLVRGGRVEQAPGRGPLSMAFCAFADGAVRFVPTEAIPSLRPASVAAAFQSYPVLLRGDGDVPAQLAAPGFGVDVAHRDARLALGELRDGRILILLTRFAAAGDALGSLPFGPTVPETAALAGALGCRQAVMLDGGTSAQLAVRDASGGLRAWRGWRDVPLALLAYPREAP